MKFVKNVATFIVLAALAGCGGGAEWFPTATPGGGTTAFNAIPDVNPITLQTSNEIQLTSGGSISVINGEYSKNNGPFTAASGTVSSGDKIRVRHFSAAATNTPQTSTVMVGTKSYTFSSMTGGQTTFTIPPKTISRASDPNLTVVDAADLTIAGISNSLTVSVSGGTPTITRSGLILDDVNPTVIDGDQLTITATIGNLGAGGTHQATVHVGNLTGTFTVNVVN